MGLARRERGRPAFRTALQRRPSAEQLCQYATARNPARSAQIRRAHVGSHFVWRCGSDEVVSEGLKYPSFLNLRHRKVHSAPRSGKTTVTQSRANIDGKSAPGDTRQVRNDHLQRRNRSPGGRVWAPKLPLGNKVV